MQGLGFFMLEEYITGPDGLVISDGTWTYKIPTVDTIPRKFNVELINSGHHEKHILSSKGRALPIIMNFTFRNTSGVKPLILWLVCKKIVCD